MRDYFGYKSLEMRTKKISLKTGDPILSSEPFAYVLENDRRGQYCAFCLGSSRDRSLFPCKKCNFHFYCSSSCVQQSWDEFHSLECANIKRCRDETGYDVPNYARLMARIIMKLKAGGDKIEEKYCNNRGRKFKDLMNHYKDIKNDSTRMRDVRSMMKVLTRYIGEENVPNESDFIGIYGRILVNRFCLTDEFNIPMGSAVYLAASVFDHACIPNANTSFIGKKLCVRTLVDLPELNLEKVRISYNDCVNSREERRQELHRSWYFWCECELCCSEERAYYENFMLCEQPGCGCRIRVPERYSRADSNDSPIIRNDDDSPEESFRATALKRALVASKLEFKSASIPVNPFASDEACMAYIFYNKDRFKLLTDSECSSESEDEDEETPSPAITTATPSTSQQATTGQETNASADYVEVNEKRTNGEQIETTEAQCNGDTAQPTVNGGADDRIEKTEPEPNPRAKELVKVASEESLGKKSKENSEERQMNAVTEEQTSAMNNSSTLDLPKKSSGAKPKLSLKNNKSIPKDDTEEEPVTTNGETNLSEITLNGETKINGVTEESEELNESPITNGYTSNWQASSIQADSMQTLEEPTKKQKRRKPKKKPYEQSDVKCPECSHYMDRNTLREYRSVVSFTVNRLKDMKEESPNFQVVMDVLERQGTIIPQLNVWKVRTLDYAFNAAYYGGAWMLALRYGMENMEGMKYFYGEQHPTLGLFYMKMGKAKMTMKFYRPALSLLDQAKPILHISMGTKHPFVIGQLESIYLMANEDPDIYMERRLARQAAQLTEVSCPCCGKKKLVYRDSVEIKKDEEQPWEKDKKVIQKLKQDSQYFSKNNYAVYY